MVIILLTVIYSLVYYIPQAPKFVSETVPNLTVTLQKNVLSLSPDDPIKVTSPESSLIIDTRATPDDYSQYPVGIFIYRDYSEFRDNNGVTQKYTFQNLKDFQISRTQIVTWLTDHKTKVILILIPITIILTGIISSFIWAMRLLGFYIWAGLIYLGLKLFKRPLKFQQIVPVVIYASILPLLISYILFFAPHPILNFLNFILFLFFSLSWLIPLTKKVENQKSVKRIK